MVNNLVVFGAQWGDEGKGRFVDQLAARADAVVRFQGGNNAGHTIGLNGDSFVLQLVPSGILYRNVINIIGNGVVVDVEGLLDEIDALVKRGVSCKNLLVSDRAHVVFDFHKKIDRLNEEMLGANKVGTTLKGIGPAYMDKIERTGIRICELVDPAVFPKLLKTTVDRKNALLRDFYKTGILDYNALLEKYTRLADRIKPYVEDTVGLVNSLSRQNKKILFEGAQGALLDMDFGTYPFVTSSHPSSVGVSAGSGLSPLAIGNILGVVKAYTSRVGEGPFPTEIIGGTGDFLRKKGGEFGSVTGRPRRIGWLDLVVVKHSALISGMTHIALSRMDTLAGVERVKICTAYLLGEKAVTNFPASLHTLKECKPVYMEFDGWDDGIAKIRNYDGLPQSAKIYVEAIEDLTNAKISMIGVGPFREEVILKERLFL